MSTSRIENDKERDLVSVVIPVYNGEKTVERALDSVVNQSYQNIEVLIIDDGSTDNTRALCLPYIEKYQNFTLLSIKNEGVSNARNLGIEMAKGKYITFFDADDELVPTFVSESVDYIVETESDIVCFDTVFVATGGGLTLPKPFDLENNIVESREEKEIIISSMFYGRMIPGHYYGGVPGAPWGKLYRLEMLKNNSIKFPYGIRVGEDSVFLIYAFSAARRIAFKGERLYKYYMLENSACHCYKENVLEERIMLFNAAKKALDETNNEIDDFDNLFFRNIYDVILYNAYVSDMPLRGKIEEIVRGMKNPHISDALLFVPTISRKDKVRRMLFRIHCYHLLAFLELCKMKVKRLH